MSLESTAKDVATVANAVKEVADPIIKVQSATAKTSLMRLTKDQVFQFPLIMDADINDDEKFPMIKSIEKNYAAIVMTAIVNEGVVDRDKYDNINKFLRKFHNNNDIPFDALEGELNISEAIASEGYLPHRDLVEMWDCVEEQLDSESINDMYLPYKRTATKLTRAVESAKLSIAMEADEQLFFKRTEYKKNVKTGTDLKDDFGAKVVLSNKDGDLVYQYIEAPEKGSKQYDDMVKKYGDPKKMSEWNIADTEKPVADAKTRNHGEIVKDDKYNSLTPTILRMSIANKESGKKGGVTTWNQELIIGVRAMPRLLPQSIMISNMVEAFKDRAIFKFIKWTRGEIKWADILFGISQAREDASMKSERRWMKILRKRAKKANGFRLGGYKLNPNCTIIITESDAHMIQEKCGVNPHDVTNVRKMMDKYFLLGFGIYDTEAKMLNIIYDGETEFTNYSMRSMIADSKKEANLLSMSKY